MCFGQLAFFSNSTLSLVYAARNASSTTTADAPNDGWRSTDDHANAPAAQPRPTPDATHATTGKQHSARPFRRLSRELKLIM